jgi:uncharacterized protein (DUF58 family)
MSSTAKQRSADAAPPADLPYRLAWRSGGVRAGSHRGKLQGSGGYFHDFAPLLQRPDPRRIDLRVSVRDPFEGLHVRRFEQKSAISVYALVDISASMAFQGRTDKIRLAADLCEALASSARRAGDAFGMICCGARVEKDLYFPASRARGSETEMLRRLRAHVPSARGSDGFMDAASLLSGKRKLVFLISDFHMASDACERIFSALSQHDIVPIVLTDTLEVEELPRWGLLSLTDLEFGRRRLVVMRPSLREAWQRRSEGRRAELYSVAARYGREPFQVRNRIDWDRLGGYLISGGA